MYKKLKTLIFNIVKVATKKKKKTKWIWRTVFEICPIDVVNKCGNITLIIAKCCSMMFNVVDVVVIDFRQIKIKIFNATQNVNEIIVR